MSNLKAVHTSKGFTPKQALISALEEFNDDSLEAVAIGYKIRIDEDTVTYGTVASNMMPETFHFLGAKIQERALAWRDEQC